MWLHEVRHSVLLSREQQRKRASMVAVFVLTFLSFLVFLSENALALDFLSFIHHLYIVHFACLLVASVIVAWPTGFPKIYRMDDLIGGPASDTE
jgi:SNF family Na+-dependent transporter